MAEIIKVDPAESDRLAEGIIEAKMSGFTAVSTTSTLPGAKSLVGVIDSFATLCTNIDTLSGIVSESLTNITNGLLKADEQLK